MGESLLSLTILATWLKPSEKRLKPLAHPSSVVAAPDLLETNIRVKLSNSWTSRVPSREYREIALSMDPFCCVVYGTLKSRWIPRGFLSPRTGRSNIPCYNRFNRCVECRYLPRNDSRHHCSFSLLVSPLWSPKTLSFERMSTWGVGNN